MMENKTADKLIEAFNEYAKHRRDKGTATAKLNAWNHLLFRMEEHKKASQQCLDMQAEIDGGKKDLQVTENVRDSYKKAYEKANEKVSELQEEVEMLRGVLSHVKEWTELANAGKNLPYPFEEVDKALNSKQ